MFASQVEDGTFPQLIGIEDVRHLLYLPLARAMLIVANWLPLEVRAYPLMSGLSLVGATASVMLLGLVLRRRFNCSPFVAAVGAAGFATSYGFWRYATEGDAYSIALALVLVLIYVGFQDQLSLRAAAVAGTLAAAAVSMHILNLPAAGVAVPTAMLLAKQWRQLVTYGIVAVVSTAGITFVAYEASSLRSVSYVEYVLFSGGDDTYEGTYSIVEAAESGVGVGQTILSGNFLFTYPSVGRKLADLYPDKLLQDDMYLGERAPAISRVAPPLVLIALVGLVAYAMIALYRMRHSINITPHRARIVAVAIWGMAYWLIKAGRAPADPESWIQVLPVLWILTAALAFEPLRSSGRRRSHVLIGGIVALIAVHNFVGGLLPVLSQRTDYHAQRANWLIGEAQVTDSIITADGTVFARYLDYYSQAVVVDAWTVTKPESMERLISANAGDVGRLLLTGDVIDILNPSTAPDSYAVGEYPQRFPLTGDVLGSLVRVRADEFGGIYEYVE